MSRDINILIVEDESIVALELESYLMSLGYKVVASLSTEEEAYRYILQNRVDIVIMDIYLENDGSGITVAKKIKQHKKIPIIFLTAYIDDATMQEALSINPVAYLVKPFNRKDIYATLKLALSKMHVIQLDSDFSYDKSTQELLYNQEIIPLNKKERKLLGLFIEKSNQIVSNELIEHIIWDDKPINSSTRRALISRLRAKLHQKFIKTFSSEGYLFEI